MELSLKNRKWKEFKVSDIFNVGTGANVPKKYLIKGNIPRISAKEQNNGVVDFTAKLNHKNFRMITNFISVSFLGSVFYHNYTASLDMKIHSIQLKSRTFNKYLAGFIVIALKRAVANASYGNQISSSDLPNKKVFLPINTQGEPDYEFMESYMRAKEQEKINAYKKYISKRIKELENAKPVVPLNEKEWKEFELGKLFIFVQGKAKGLNHLVKSNNGINYLGATNLNNGVLCQVEPQKELIHKGNAIAFIRNGEGSMGYSVYKAEDFIATSDISVGYNPNLNRYNGTFITTVADKVRGKYNFGYKRSAKRLKKEKIMLPVNSSGEPDYEYMENYMKRLELEKLKKYLKYKEQNKKETSKD